MSSAEHIKQVITESMAAWRAGYRIYKLGAQLPPNTYITQHEIDCFSMGFKSAERGEPYNKSSPPEDTLQLSIGIDSANVELEITLYSEGCSQ